MTNTEELIKVAAENGWNDETAKVISHDYRDGHEGMATSMYSTHKALLDPLFWQALARGLKLDVDMEYYYCPKDKAAGDYVSYKHCPQCGEELVKEIRTTKNWKMEMHRFIDHLAEGHSIEDYAGKLLSK